LAVAGLAVWALRPAGTPPPAIPSYAQMPVPVSIVLAELGSLQMDLHAVGTVTPLQQVAIRSQVDGELARVHFQEGQRVAQGDLLAEIDARPFQVRLASAEGEAERIHALWQNARTDLRRYQALARQDSVAGRLLDEARAQERAYAAQLRGAQARVDEARLQLSHTRIVAPLDGRMGLRGVDAGNQVRAADTASLATLVQTAPISALFTIAETRLEPLRQALAEAGQAGLRVQAWDADNRRLLAEGTLRALDNRIDLGNGTLRLRAHFDNQGEPLFPNQFVNIRLRLARTGQAVVIPSAAVQYGAAGPYAYIIDDKQRAARRTLVLGPATAGRVAVVQGLQPDDKVVLEGIDRLEDGRAVLIVEQAGQGQGTL
ncbi:efflux RND transporter periplasmic adaptor subunit, partial [Bordetella petrii]|uniref:efflux RND transporter periplasmic adaptor subunit n=1 Tax=Bordetella petrii TaxID=94624 RepID=UPI001E41026B